MEYQKNHTCQQRKEECERLINKYPNKVPVIVERANATDPSIGKYKKYLLSGDTFLSYFINILRNKMTYPDNKKLSSESAIFVFTEDKVLCPPATTLSMLYKEHKNPEDGFLYLIYGTEATFG